MAKPVQTIEQTAKRWKAMQLVGGFGVIVGLGLFIACSWSGVSLHAMALWLAATITTTVGVGLYIAGRLLAWWFHG